MSRFDEQAVAQAALIEGNALITESRSLRGARTDDEWARSVEREEAADGWETLTITLTYYRISVRTGRPVEVVVTKHRYEIDERRGEVVLCPLTEDEYQAGRADPEARA